MTRPSGPIRPFPQRPAAAAHPWGIGDVIAAWIVGLVASVVAALVHRHRHAHPGASSSLLLVVQDGTIIAWLAFVARRKGLGSLEADFGLRAIQRGKTWRNNVPWFFAGVGLQLVWLPALVLLQEVHGDVARQEVVRIADRSTGVGIPLIILAVGVLAPVAEELLFRGALLRSLLRRMSSGWAVFVSAAIFGLVHSRRPVDRHADRVPGDPVARPGLRVPGRRRRATWPTRSCCTWASTP